MRSRFFIRIFLVLYIFGVGISYSQPSANDQCLVKGLVLDDQGNVFLGLDIEFFDGVEKKVAKAHENGSYEITLKRGVYEIGIWQKYDYYAYKRAKINLSCDPEIKELTINIYPFGKRVSYGDKSPEYKFDTIKLGKLEDDSDIVVAYLKKKRMSKSRSVYESAMLTFDRFTISAESIVIDPVSRTFVAHGNGWIEDGKQRREFNDLAFVINKNGLEIQR